jgi:hypothetical protein
MQPWARYFLILLCTLALVAGSTVSFAASVSPAPSCAHEHGHADHPAPEPQKHHGAGCLSCCLGACVAIPDLPLRAEAAVLFTALPVLYWETNLSLPSRVIAPDLGPPRSQI